MECSLPCCFPCLKKTLTHIVIFFLLEVSNRFLEQGFAAINNSVAGRHSTGCVFFRNPRWEKIGFVKFLLAVQLLKVTTGNTQKCHKRKMPKRGNHAKTRFIQHSHLKCYRTFLCKLQGAAVWKVQTDAQFSQA